MESFDKVLFDKVLVANRGEIARRLFRTLREMGLGTVAVFSDADADAPHVHEADEAVRLGPAPSADSYLNVDAVLEAARRTGAGAVHPGYGFLAENADFAERCAAEGLIFIGPSPEAIRRMGDKAAAKALAAEAGVPVLEGFPLEGLSPEEVQRRGEEMGFPLMIKAVAGGGGKGMRRVAVASDLEDALAAAAREAENAFGDGSLLIERCVESPRHVEIQVLGDAHGHLVHLCERDCSIQRRHQKVFEECPSPAVDADLRRRMGDAALALARAVRYQGAGTVEFLLDASGEFFFLEMNTRLQVEHPVTEEVLGLDLVRLQVEVAQGLPLELRQEEIVPRGHALEARLYAEDPSRDFLPVTGRVSLWAPPQLPGLRIDGGLEAGQEVTSHYDPMLAKVIAHGRDREEARRRLRRGLQELAVGGLTTNRDFLLDVLEHDHFRRGELETSFLSEVFPEATRGATDAVDAFELHAVAATLFLVEERRRGPGPLPEGIPSGWRNHPWRAQRQNFVVSIDGQEKPLRVLYRASEGGFQIAVTRDDSPTGDDPSLDRWASALHRGDGVLQLEVDGLRRPFRLAADRELRRFTVHGLGRVAELTAVRRFPERRAAAVAGACAAPMTGRVVEVLVSAGEEVEAGSPLVVLEAMKMEHRLLAHADGVVEQVNVEPGQMVDPDEILVVVTASSEAP